MKSFLSLFYVRSKTFKVIKSACSDERLLNLFATRPLVTLIQHVEESNRHCRDLSLFVHQNEPRLPPAFRLDSQFRVVVGDMHHVDYTGALWCRFHVLICVPVHK